MSDQKRKKITVLHIIDSLPREGAEILLYDLIQQSSRKRFDFLVCALTRGGGVADLLRKIDVPLLILGRNSRWDLGAFLRLISFIRQKKVDIVHTHLFSSNLWGRTAAWLAGARFIFSTEHNTSEWKNFFQRATDFLLSWITDRIIAVSQPVHDSLISACRVSPAKVVVIENGLNLSRLKFKPDRGAKLKELDLPPESKLVGTAAALTPKKGYKYLLGAAAEIIRRRKEVYFLFLGEGELRTELARAIQDKGLPERVRLLGSRADAVEIISLLDIFVLSSIREGLSIALLEAMAQERAVIVTSVGGITTLVEDGVSGLVVSPASSSALARGIDRLLEEPELGRRLGESAGRRVRARYDIETMVKRYEELYLSVLGDRVCGRVKSPGAI